MHGAVAGTGDDEWGFDCIGDSVGKAGILLSNDDGRVRGAVAVYGSGDGVRAGLGAFLAKERTRGEAYFRREFLCEFLETGKYLIEAGLVRRAFQNQEEAWQYL